MLPLKKTLLSALSLLKPEEQTRFKLLIALNLLLSIADIAILALLLAVVSLYTGENRIVALLPGFARNASSLLPIISLLLLLCIKNIVGYKVFSSQSGFFFRIASRISRQKLLNYLEDHYEQYVRSERAQVFNGVNYRPIEFAQNILASLQLILTESALVFLTIIAILVFKPGLFILLIIFLLPPVVLSGLLVRRRLNHVKQHIRQDEAKTNQYFNEAFSSFIESNLFGKKAFFTGRHAHFQQKLSNHIAQLQITQWIPSRLVELFAVLGLFVLILVNKLLGVHSDLVDIGAFIAAAYKIMPGITRIANASALLKTYGYVISDLPGNNKDIPVKSLTQPTDKIRTIQFNAVSFWYRAELPVLRNFSTSFDKGDFACISGASGKGKTSLIHLLLGFLTPSEGNIAFNGTALSPSEIREYYPSFSYVPQQTHLLQDTVATNITLEESVSNPERLQSAIEFAGLQPLIASLENGRETIIADSGKDLSGGQKQRIAIARALYRNADILILDEPFNELDQASERLLLEKFRELSNQGKIVILISHNDLCRSYCNKHIQLPE